MSPPQASLSGERHPRLQERTAGHPADPRTGRPAGEPCGPESSSRLAPSPVAFMKDAV
jgi:hypothetical protein